MTERAPSLDAAQLLEVARGDAQPGTTLDVLWNWVSPVLLLAAGGYLLWANVFGTEGDRIAVVLGIFLIAYAVSSWVENEEVENRLDALVALLERNGTLPADEEA